MKIQKTYLYFIISLILAVLLSRVITYFYDFEIMIGSFELHHFYEGIILLIIAGVLLLFNKKYNNWIIIVFGFGIGLIIDGVEGVIKGFETIPEYNSTLLSSVTLTIIIILIGLYLNYKRN